MSKKRMFGIIGTVIVVAVGGFLVYSNIIATSGNDSAGMPVITDVARVDTIVNTVNAKGEVSLLNTELIYSNIAAEVEEVLVEKNDVIKKDDVLIRYKDKSREKIEEELKTAELNLRSSELSLSDALVPPSQVDVERAKLNVSNAEQAIKDAEYVLEQLDITIERQQRTITDAEKAVTDAEKVYNDTKILYTAGAASQSELDAAERPVDTARNTLQDEKDKLVTYNHERTQKTDAIQSAKDNLAYVQLEYEKIKNRMQETQTQNTISQREIAVEQGHLRVESLKADLADFQKEICSPIDGTITKLNVSKGEITGTDKILMEISNVEDFIVEVDVNERHAAKIQLGQKAAIEGAVLGDKTVTGTVSKISNIAEIKQSSTNTERVITVEIEVDSSEDAKILKPGFSLEASITTEVLENVVVVPILSTLSDKDGNYVYVIKDDNTLEKRSVVLGAYADMTVEVTGISAGERIVAQPTLNMAEGMAVVPMQPEGEAETGNTQTTETADEGDAQ